MAPMPDLSDEKRFPAGAGPVDDPELLAAWEGMDPADQRYWLTTSMPISARRSPPMSARSCPDRQPFDAYVAALLEGDETAMAGQPEPG